MFSCTAREFVLCLKFGNFSLRVESDRHVRVSYLVGSAGVAVLVVLDEGQKTVDGRRALDDVFDAVILRTVLQNLEGFLAISGPARFGKVASS